jgi:prepilin-type N-terminal cleavage/methylation domain-containing protein
MSRAFSLFELVVVLVIIAIVYGVGVSYIKHDYGQDGSLTFKDIKQYMIKNYPHQNIELRLYGDKKTALYREGREVKVLGSLFESDTIHVYAEDLDGFYDVKYEQMRDGKKLKKVDLVFKVDSDRKSESILVEDGKGFYLYRGFSSEATRFNSLEDANSYIKALRDEIDAL